MMPNAVICVCCSQKIEEKEKSVKVPHQSGGVAHLACAQKVMIRTELNAIAPRTSHEAPPEPDCARSSQSWGGQS
jgi:hypothetical protein